VLTRLGAAIVAVFVVVLAAAIGRSPVYDADFGFRPQLANKARKKKRQEPTISCSFPSPFHCGARARGHGRRDKTLVLRRLEALGAKTIIFYACSRRDAALPRCRARRLLLRHVGSCELRARSRDRSRRRRSTMRFFCRSRPAIKPRDARISGAHYRSSRRFDPPASGTPTILSPTRRARTFAVSRWRPHFSIPRSRSSAFLHHRACTRDRVAFVRRNFLGCPTAEKAADADGEKIGSTTRPR